MRDNSWANSTYGHRARVTPKVTFQPAWFRELRQIGAADAAQTRPVPKAPLTMVCRDCGVVPRSKQARARWRPTADGKAWLCVPCQRCQHE